MSRITDYRSYGRRGRRTKQTGTKYVNFPREGTSKGMIKLTVGLPVLLSHRSKLKRYPAISIASNAEKNHENET